MFAGAAQPLGLVSPTGSEVVAAGDDYATQQLGDAWDMDNPVDVDSEESIGINNQTFSAGAFAGDTAGNGAYFYPLFMGYSNSFNQSRGASYPIDTSHYRYVTIKVRATKPPGTNQFARVIALKDGDSYRTVQNGNPITPTLIETPYSKPLADDQWAILSFDMTVDDGKFYHWTDFPQVTGLRVDPATTNASGTYASVHFAIDWIRLTAPATAAEQFLVQWTDSGYAGNYDVSAVDGDLASFSLGKGVAGTSLLADLSKLAPGPYQIIVARTNNSATPVSATLTINRAPQVDFSAPSERGDQAQDFATMVPGNPWGPIDAGDFAGIVSFDVASINYTNPVGSFYGRPNSNNPGWYMNLGGQSLNADLYRSLCFTMRVFGPRDIGTGSVARVFWRGSGDLSLSTTKALPLHSGTASNEYCIEDIAQAPLDTTFGGPWRGNKIFFEIDPHEFPVSSDCTNTPSPSNCHDVQLDSVILAPFAAADPSYTIQWSLSDDADGWTVGSSVNLLLNPDRTNNLGSSIPIATLPYATGAQQFTFTTKKSILNGKYYVGIQASDGINTVLQFAGGPILVDNSDLIFGDGFE